MIEDPVGMMNKADDELHVAASVTERGPDAKICMWH